jgi:hypothetical protein
VSAARALLLAAAALGPSAEPAPAQPRSAIPWLSDSVAAAPVPLAPAAPSVPPLTEGPVIVTPLEEVGRNAAGILTPEASGLPPKLWGSTPASRVRELILDHPDRGVPAARALFRRLLLAQADPPAGSGPEAEILLARLDRLLDIGALDEAEALLLAAGPETPELFRRWFDIGLLTNDAEEQCAALRQNPALSPTLPARVFCLARGGDWNAAEITLTLGGEVGSITPEQRALLGRFLDPVLFEEDPAPPIPRPLTALDFTLREAVGLPRPPGALPLAFLRGDLDPHAPMRVRIGAAERLVLAGSAAPEALFDAYRAGAPAASGGVWDRARAVQALDAALEGPAPPAELAEALATADIALSTRGLRAAFTAAYAPSLETLDPAALPEAARDRLAELLLLAAEPAAAAKASGPAPFPRAAALLALAAAAVSPTEAAPEDERLQAALRGLADRPPRDDRETRLAGMIAEGRAGEAILEALALLEPGPAVDPAALEAALFTLSAAGQRDAARAVALQTLLLPGPG